MDYNDVSSRFDFMKSTTRFPISCIFLSQFDMKRGNVIVWSKLNENCNINLQGTEFKSLPSGVHEVSDDVINFILPKEETSSHDHYYGVAYYRQNGQEIVKKGKQVDRNEVKMYALGILIDPNLSLKCYPDDEIFSSRHHKYISCNEYVGDLKKLLSDWLQNEKYDDFSTFESFYNTNKKTIVKADDGSSGSKTIRSSELTDDIEDTPVPIANINNKLLMLEHLPFWIKKIGPLIFPLWKSCLLNEKILILNPLGGSFELCNSLVYCISLISLIHKKNMKAKDEYDDFISPLFTIGVNDIDFLNKVIKESGNSDYQMSSFVACTSDEVLAYRPELYDIMLKLPPNFMSNDNDTLPKLVRNDGEIIKATPHELEIYEKLMNIIMNEKISPSQRSKLEKLTEPVSWVQYLIDGFYLCTTAGYLKAAYRNKSTMSFTMFYENNDENETKLNVVLNLIKYFHFKTVMLLNQVQAMIESNECHNSSDVIHTSPVSLTEMDLDCFSEQDIDFVEKLISKRFKRNLVVNNGDYFRAAC
ncbi:hypothetical protein Kpol_1056p3 [Vanderwaltozyma polyspora DSM 70294]|uniref:DUF4484 domain-containing protein n=1 Tax=Vanderwaltozyma polyspora (strain ATCC 22028 / DSM 70294 / BCRC 21397 / CBS 2163 / NBRC 10782 / NRRL Y-8283 / UCD 57-17) TaxID=436907 RepID=A7TLL1_VANPO|nr:uncharacterized protein Kpol_1056p3 [Vanderwaltozyma polyspora DSM 70294]EDO16803.1 hypothetical protein Kpol_1056p3 [Vanderwaltozyma polyspora DSM 70294]